jgi:O-methyltransferase domain
LPPDALIVDVGGGVGGAMMSLFKAFPHLRFAVQDTTKMIEIGEQVRNASIILHLLLINRNRFGISNSQMLSLQAESDYKVITTL